MPLHNAIPLCKFQYVRDIFSGTTFEYDTSCKIDKDDGQKSTCVNVLIEIEKISTKLMYKSNFLIIKADNVRLMYKNTAEINKTSSQLMYKEISGFDKLMVERSLRIDDSEINIEHDSILEREDMLIAKSDQKELNKLVSDLNKNDPMDLESQTPNNIIIESSKKFEGVTPLLMNQSSPIHLGSVIPSCINKVTVINLAKTYIPGVEKMDHKYLSGQSIIGLSKDRDVIMQCETLRDVNIIIPNVFMNRITETLVNKSDEGHYVDVITELDISKDSSDKYVNRLNGQENITKDNSIWYLKREGAFDIKRDDYIKLINRDAIANINQYSGGSLLERLTINQINKDQSMMNFSKITIKDIDRMPFQRLLQRMDMIDIFDINCELQLDRLHLADMFKIQENYLDRLHITEVFKLDTNYMDHMPLVPIYKEYQKPILDITIKDIYSDLSRLLKDTTIKDIYLPQDSKYIEITKRWWWLDSSSPRDHLIVPNKDYKKMSELLSNHNYEYLRYSNHPIEWGKGWGIDWSIPPETISIETMLDLTNIITMIWHKNVQGWLRVSGKEAIQLIMELVFDWYSMGSSDPNSSYYRAYRWVRWEAEKVYFLETDNGLQAIGILVANLRDYLKFHHFNRVPIWSNPKAMDEERNFNRKADNGDLMKDLDKTKGKRHYYIETQNFEKKNRSRSE